MKTRRDIIFDTVTDLVNDFLYYDRKKIEEAIKDGEITKLEIYNHFISLIEKNV